MEDSFNGQHSTDNSYYPPSPIAEVNEEPPVPDGNEGLQAVPDAPTATPEDEKGGRSILPADAIVEGRVDLGVDDAMVGVHEPTSGEGSVPTADNTTQEPEASAAASEHSPSSPPQQRRAASKSTIARPILTMPFSKKKMGTFTRRRCLEAAAKKAKYGGLVGSVKPMCPPIPTSIYMARQHHATRGIAAGVEEVAASPESNEDHILGGEGTDITVMREKVSRLRGMEGLFFVRVAEQSNRDIITDTGLQQFSKQRSYKMMYLRLINSTQSIQSSPSGSPNINRTYSPFGAGVRGPTMYGGKQPPRGSVVAPGSPTRASPLRTTSARGTTSPRKGPPKAPSHVAFKSAPTTPTNRHDAASQRPHSSPPPLSSDGIIEIYDAEADLDAGEFMVLERLVAIPLGDVTNVRRSAIDQKDALLMPSAELGVEYKFGQLLLHLSLSLTVDAPSPPPVKVKKGPDSPEAKPLFVKPSQVLLEVDLITNCANERDLWFEWISKFILHADMVELHTDRQPPHLQFNTQRPVKGVRPFINHFIRGAKKKAGGGGEEKSSAIPKLPGEGFVVVYCEDVPVKRRLQCQRIGEVVLSSFSTAQRITIPLKSATVWVKNPLSNELLITLDSVAIASVENQQTRAKVATVDLTEDGIIEIKAVNPYDRDLVVLWFLKIKGGVPQPRFVTYPYEAGAEADNFTFRLMSPKRHKRRHKSGSLNVSGQQSEGGSCEEDTSATDDSDSAPKEEAGTAAVSPLLRPGFSTWGDQSPSDSFVLLTDMRSRSDLSRTKSKLFSNHLIGGRLDSIPPSADPRPLFDRKRLGRSASFVNADELSRSLTGANFPDASTETRVRRRLSMICKNRDFLNLDPNPRASSERDSESPSKRSNAIVSRRAKPSTRGSAVAVAAPSSDPLLMDVHPLDAVNLIVNPIVLRCRVQYGEIGGAIPPPTPTNPFFPHRIVTVDYAGERVYVLEGVHGSTVAVDLSAGKIDCVTAYSSVFGSSGITLHCLSECVEVCILLDEPAQRRRLLFALNALGIRCHDVSSREDINRKFMEDHATERAKLDARQGLDVAHHVAMLYPCALCGKQSYVCDFTGSIHFAAVKRLCDIEAEQALIKQKAIMASFEADFATSSDDDADSTSNTLMNTVLPSMGDWLFASLPHVHVPNPRTVGDLKSIIAKSKLAISRMESVIEAANK